MAFFDEAKSKELEETGVVVLENVYTPDDILAFTAQFDSGWAAVSDKLHDLQWQKRLYRDAHAPSFILGRGLYQGKLVAAFRGTQVVDMGHGRYDFTHGLEGGVLASDRLLAPDSVYGVVHAALKRGYSGYVGGLPVLPNPSPLPAGYWHRDAYSLYEDEAFDLALPPFYYTMIVPLTDMEEGNGATEFVPGSHKFDFAGHNIGTPEKVKAWADTQPRRIPAVKAGSVCIFHGFTLHRGGSNMSDSRRDALYVVFKKNWYSDEDPTDYVDAPLDFVGDTPPPTASSVLDSSPTTSPLCTGLRRHHTPCRTQSP